MPVDSALVRVSGIHKFFTRGSERVDVLQNLSLEVPAAQFLGLMGPSGSGKTTLLNLIAGLDSPSEGEIWVGDQEISGMSEAQLARWRTRSVGFVFQFYHLLPELNVIENTMLHALVKPSLRGLRNGLLVALDIGDARHRRCDRTACINAVFCREGAGARCERVHQV